MARAKSAGSAAKKASSAKKPAAKKRTAAKKTTATKTAVVAKVEEQEVKPVIVEEKVPQEPAAEPKAEVVQSKLVKQEEAVQKVDDAAKETEQAEPVAEVLVEQIVEAVSDAPVEEENKPDLSVLLVASECSPFAKTGGLADVMGTLPAALQKCNVDARVMIPFHAKMKSQYACVATHIADFYIQMGWRREFVGVEKLEYEGVTYYLIDNNYFFGGPIYKGGLEEGAQYAFFTRAVLEAMDYIDFDPQVVHCNDWQCGMIPMLAKTQYGYRKQSSKKYLFTIHNIMYQGKYDFEFVKDLLHVEDKYFTGEFIELYGCANFLKAGIVFSDKINTVSPTYAQEIKNPYFAYDLEGILNARSNDTWGILNGIDTDIWNPETDSKLPAHYTADDLSGKEVCKQRVMEELGLEYCPGRPLIGIISRLTAQKGLDMIMSVFDDIMRQDCSFVLLGSGDHRYEQFFRDAENRYRGRVCSYIGYNEDLSHRIYAGCDLFLMPSVFEPCGISQMIALRYGTLPIVRETGGLKDTVGPYNEYTGEGNGFSFANINAYDMLTVIGLAIHTYKNPEARNMLIKHAMAADHSFATSAQAYKNLYLSL